MQISSASIETLIKQASDALEDTYVEVLCAVDDSAVRGADETSWQRAGQTHWLSVATAEQAALFQLSDRRDRDTGRDRDRWWATGPRRQRLRGWWRSGPPRNRRVRAQLCQLLASALLSLNRARRQSGGLTRAKRTKGA
ncbi:MAG: hypothetical protein ACR2LK_12260 [Solirubrobacteraceae bacterium]